MSLQVTLTNAKINAGRLGTGGQQKIIQGSDYIPVIVNLSAEITIGLAILTAIAADDALWAQFNEAAEEDILRAITSIAFVAPVNSLSLQAYTPLSQHVRPIVATEVTYLPFSRLYRNYISGGTTTDLLDVGVSV